VVYEQAAREIQLELKDFGNPPSQRAEVLNEEVFLAQLHSSSTSVFRKP
jgi:hypothetical protein